MNYKLELNTQGSGSSLVFNNIVFDSFKVNIVERHIGSTRSALKFNHVLFKVRTLDDVIVKTKNGNNRIMIKGEELVIYEKLVKTLGSYEYRNKLINRKQADEDYVHFILRLVILNYDLN
ncbi:prevent-host-death protein [Elizabethkingia occulta]|uniref:Prevent-host-death protein n=1 Tax=Elizabethkingia occulta TaxID=1867263 RepID=A0A1T3MSR0_9FLAO|nr:prevent-host-death protein [Elizabethkingia occulta]OPB87852.1 prevent-host-death protein [Elizabethkingia occulta]OPC67614.1 prevent-host-death protein [Elizabethkingia occulta]